jgi:TonB-dependent SusC/RagA subfamily outer membrane receptor
LCLPECGVVSTAGERSTLSLNIAVAMRLEAVRFDHRRYRILRPAGRRVSCVLALVGLTGCLARPPSPGEPAAEADAREPPFPAVQCEAVTEADVLQLSTSLSLIDILRTRIPGLRVSTNWQSGESSSLGLRGNNSFVGPREPLVFVDGIRLPQPGGIEYVEFIDPLDVERIEILRGPAATALYGTGASSGVILIYSKRGVDNASRSGDARGGCRP